MSTTLLDISADGSPLISDGFRVALTSGGAIGISCRVTTGGAALTRADGNPLTRQPVLHITPSNFTDGPDGTTATDTQAELGGAGSVAIPLERSGTASEVRYTEAAIVASGPVMYGYLEFFEELSATVAIEVEALEL